MSDALWSEMVSRELRLLWESVAEMRDGLVDLDHAKAPRAQLNELHTKVDALEDDFSVLRNDYRGEAT